MRSLTWKLSAYNSRGSRLSLAARCGVSRRRWPARVAVVFDAIRERARRPLARCRASRPAPESQRPLGVGGVQPGVHRIPQHHDRRTVRCRLRSAAHAEQVRRLSLQRSHERQRAFPRRQQLPCSPATTKPARSPRPGKMSSCISSARRAITCECPCTAVSTCAPTEPSHGVRCASRCLPKC